MGIAPCATGFQNTEWSLAPEGLEHRATGYFIDRSTLAARRADGLWDWPLHMAEKSWCGLQAFRDAFLAALRVFGIDADERLGASLALAERGREGRTAAPADAGFVQLGAYWPLPRPARASARRLAQTARQAYAAEPPAREVRPARAGA